MKCKQQRKKQKERAKLSQGFISKMKELNPERTFLVEEKNSTNFTDTITIYVDTDELWNLILPESCELVLGKNRKEIECRGFIQLIQEKYFL